MSETDKTAPERRHSHAQEPELIADAVKLAEAEAANGLRQFDLGRSAAQAAIDNQNEPEYRFRLRHSLILSLHREALAGISSYAGNYRPAGVTIGESRHTPPGAHQVPELIEEMCDYVNDRWATAMPIHLAAYVMWQLDWIHPFADGNGRTARISSYVVLMIKSGFILPGSPTIPDQIVSDRGGYFNALDAADAASREGRIDVSVMEELLAAMLARQLAGFYQAVGGKLPPGIDLDRL